MLRVKRGHPHLQSLTPEPLLRGQAAIAADGAPDRPDEAVLRYVRELAKRLAQQDHDAEVAHRTSQPQSKAAE